MNEFSELLGITIRKIKAVKTPDPEFRSIQYTAQKKTFSEINFNIIV
jgi:hypothetical protein